MDSQLPSAPVMQSAQAAGCAAAQGCVSRPEAAAAEDSGPGLTASCSSSVAEAGAVLEDSRTEPAHSLAAAAHNNNEGATHVCALQQQQQQQQMEQEQQQVRCASIRLAQQT